MSTLKDLLRISLPMVVGQLSFASMSFIDTLLMGQLGVEVIAGGGLGTVVYQFFYVVGLGVLVATANLIAFAKGENNGPEIHRALLSGVVLVAVLFVISAIIIWNFKTVLLAFGQEVELVVLSERYLRVVVWGLFPAFGFILLRSLVLGVGDPSAILPISVIAAALNYPVSYVLMTGQFGLPTMGLEGIALGTCIISFAMFFGLMFLVYRKDTFKPFPFWCQWQSFSSSQLKETVKLGVPIALAHAMEIGMFSAAAFLIGWVGVHALAAHQVALQCATLSFMVPLGLSQAVSVKIGEHYGARSVEHIRSVARNGMLLATVSACLAGCVFWLFPEWLISLFLSEGQGESYAAVVELTVKVLFVAALFQLVDAWQVVLMGMLRGFKLGASPTVVSIISYWFVGFPCAYWLLSDFGAVGVWIGMGAGLAVSALMLAVLFRYVMRKKMSA